MSVTRPILRYHGGKFGAHGSVADWTIAQLPTHRVYVEPFGGAASVLLRKPRAYAEVYNDLSGEVVNVFQQMRDRPAELERLLRLTPFARAEFQAACKPAEDALEQARRTIVRSLMGHSTASATPGYATGFRANSNRSGTTPARDWLAYPGNVDDFAARLQGVVIEQRDGCEVMRQHDGRQTLHFVDPPYVAESRKSVGAYVHEMTNADHRALAECLRGLTGMVVLCGYPSALYDELYPDWPRIDRKAYADGARERTECLWFNPSAWEARPAQELPLEVPA